MIDKQAEQIRKLKKMVKVYAKRMKDGEGRLPLNSSYYYKCIKIDIFAVLLPWQQNSF